MDELVALVGLMGGVVGVVMLMHGHPRPDEPAELSPGLGGPEA